MWPFHQLKQGKDLSVSNPNNDLMQDPSLSGNAQGNILNKEKRVEVKKYIYISSLYYSVMFLDQH